jgi:hypothetical protein
LDTELFDHKHINLEFNSTKRQTRHFIKPFIFNQPCFSTVVDIAVAECYLHHADLADPELDIEEGLLHVGRLIKQLNT